MSFIPSVELPKSITQLNIGSNIESFGEYEPTSSLSRVLANVEEINVDPKTTLLNRIRVWYTAFTTRTDLTSFPLVFVVLHSDLLRDWIRTW